MADAANKNPSGARRPKSGDWRSDADAEKTSRGKLIAITLFVMVAAAGLLIGFVVYIPEPPNEPLLVSVPIGEYKHPAWPVNPWADRDADVLCEQFRRRGEQSLAFKGFEFQQLTNFRLLLDWVAGRSTTTLTGVQADAIKRPLVLHITALAATRNGVVYLLPGDATPAEGTAAPPSWVPVADVIDAVAGWPGKNKLLLLDLAHAVADPFSGVVRDDAATHLDTLLKARLTANTLTYPVLTSCEPGELSRPADPARCSVFALYVAEAMKGLADGYNSDGDRDTQVTAAELARFVTARVNRYTRIVHNRRQTPHLYTPSDAAVTFALAYQVPPPPAPPAADAEPPPGTPPVLFPAFLQQGWQTRDEGRAAGLDRDGPPAYARLTRGLLRAETEWRWAGRDGRAEAEWARAKSAWEADARGSGRPTPATERLQRAVQAVGGFRLAAARTGKPPVAPDWYTAFDQYLAAKRADPPKPEDEVKLRQAWLDKATTNPVDAAWVVWDRARLASAPDRKTVAAWAEAVDELKPPIVYAEVLLLQALAAWDFRREQGLATYPATTIAGLIQAEYEVGLTVAVSPEGFGLVRETVAVAETDRFTGVKALYAAGVSGGARTELDRAEDLFRRAIAGFRDARETLKRWQEASRVWEAAVPAILDTMPAAVGRNRPPADEWEAAAGAVSRLATKLEAVTQTRRFDPSAMAEDIGATRAATERLRKPFDSDTVKRATEPPPEPKAALLDPLYDLVEGPALTAADRKKVWDVIRTTTTKLHDQVRQQQDAVDDTSRVATAAATASAPLDPEDALTTRRVESSLALLRLAGFDNATTVASVVQRLLADPASSEAATVAGDRLRAAWAVEVLAELQAAETSGRTFAAERVLRVYPPQAVPPNEFRADTISRRAIDDERTYRDWVRTQLLADKPYRSVPKEKAEAFFPAVAGLAQ